MDIISAAPRAPMDPRAFRNALGSFVTGVTIVTGHDPETGDVGLTANSFNSVSLDPPLILWSLALTSTHLDMFRRAEWWAVHVLGSDQQELSARFAQAGIDKFEGVEIPARGPGGIPLLEGCAARFICRTANQHEGGDHIIFVGEVVEFERAPRPPLVYHEGRYGRIMPPPSGQEAVQHFLGHALRRAEHGVMRQVRGLCRRESIPAGVYGVLMALGSAGRMSLPALLAHAAESGADLPQDAVREAVGRGWAALEEDSAVLTAAGRSMVSRLNAAASEDQTRAEAQLSEEERGLLQHLLDRLGGSPS